jgi:hypothetical protein
VQAVGCAANDAPKDLHPNRKRKMLTYQFTEDDVIRNRGLQASTLVNQPFWKELEIYMAVQIQDALEKLDGAKYADDRVKANLLYRWQVTKDLVARIEQFPVAAIEAARELGEQNGQAVQSSRSWD